MHSYIRMLYLHFCKTRMLPKTWCAQRHTAVSSGLITAATYSPLCQDQVVILGWVSLIVLLQAGCWRIFIVSAVNTSLCSCSSVAPGPFTDLSNDAHSFSPVSQWPAERFINTFKENFENCLPKKKLETDTSETCKYRRQTFRVSPSPLWATFIKLSHWHLNGGAYTEHRYLCTVYYMPAWGSWKKSSHTEAWKTRLL